MPVGYQSTRRLSAVLGLSALLVFQSLAYGLVQSDPSERYVAYQGQGGLEAIICADGITRGIVSDWNGNAVGWVDKPGASITWSPAQYLAWGPAPGWGSMPQDGTKPLYQLHRFPKVALEIHAGVGSACILPFQEIISGSGQVGYRGFTVDPPGYLHGYLQHGLRAYDPSVGRWLSPDPAGHEGSLSLYDYCDNDPLNVYDPDGRFGKQPLSHYSIQALAQVSSMFRGSQYTGGPVYASRGSPYASAWDKMSHGEQVSAVLNFVPVVGTAKSLFEGMTGRDFIAGRDLSASEQVLSAGMGIASVLSSTASIARSAARGSVASGRGIASMGGSKMGLPMSPGGGGLPKLSSAERLAIMARHEQIARPLLLNGEIAVEKGTMSAKIMADITRATNREVALLRMGDNSRVLRLGDRISVSTEAPVGYCPYSYK